MRRAAGTGGALRAVRALLVLAVALGPGVAGGDAAPADREILLQSTTSTQSSGLFDHLLPLFTRRTGIRVRVVAVGTGQALANARNGDADLVLVHAPEAEEEFVAAGFGVERRPVMHNDFVIVGPADDPAGTLPEAPRAAGRPKAPRAAGRPKAARAAGRPKAARAAGQPKAARAAGEPAAASDAAAALRRIAAARAIFLSRADGSGTHRKEMDLWEEAGVDPRPASGSWYRETGSGMGATLNMAVGMGAYTLVDRGTWLAFSNRGDLEVLVEGDPRLVNPYSAILVSPERHPHVAAEAGRAFIDWLTGPEGREAIASHRVGGQQLFSPAAGASGAGPPP